jgi:hypothetical protein
VTSVFDNDATVDSQIGGLRFGGGGGPTTNTGSFDATGNVLQFDGGTSTSRQAPPSPEPRSSSPARRSTMRGPTTSPAPPNVTAGAAHFTGTVTSVGAALTISGGTADFSSGETIA